MQSKITIQIKAAFLLVVFSLNSIMGFACSLGIDLGYNRGHHTPIVTNEEQTPGHCDFTEPSAESNSAPAEHHDCCKDEVVKFTLSDKSPASSIKLDAPAQFALDVAAMYFLSVWNPQQVSTIHYYVQSDHPPISKDIRVAIQSFLI